MLEVKGNRGVCVFTAGVHNFDRRSSVRQISMCSSIAESRFGNFPSAAVKALTRCATYRESTNPADSDK